MESILEDDSYYRKTYDAFLSTVSTCTTTTGTTPSRQEWLLDILSSGKILTYITESVAICAATGTAHTLRSMGVGGGDGVSWDPIPFYTETVILSKLLPHFSTVYQRAVEPNETLLTLYKQLVSEKSQDFNCVTFDWRQETLEDYCKSIEKVDDNTKFHFISAVHSAYHFSDIEESLGSLYRQLEHGGVLLVVMVAEDSCAAQIGMMMPKVKRIHYMSIRAVCDYFESKGIPYDKVRLARTVDVSRCFDAVITEEASLLLDFFTRIRGFMKSSIPIDVKENVLTAMRSMAVRSPIGKELVDHSEIAVVVRRQPDI